MRLARQLNFLLPIAQTPPSPSPPPPSPPMIREEGREGRGGRRTVSPLEEETRSVELR